MLTFDHPWDESTTLYSRRNEQHTQLKEHDHDY